MSGRSPYPHRRDAHRLAAAVLTAALLTGCAATPAGPATTPGGAMTPVDQPPTGPVPPEVMERADVQAAVAAEAARSGVASTQVSVAGYSEVTWSDGSLGCPQPGVMYPQALVPGSLLVLEVDGRLASYHAARGKPFSYCARPVLPPSGETNPNA